MTASEPQDSIAWINGTWGQPAELALPLSDRGLQLADGLFETVLLHHNRPCLLDAHLRRWEESSELLGMAAPPKRPWLDPLIQEAIERLGLEQRYGAMRLNWSRGDGNQRGIGLDHNAADPSKHRFWLTLQTHTPTFESVRTWISCHEYRLASSLMSRCKTFSYGQAIQVRREAQQKGADDGLMLSTNGTLCCGSSANLVVQRHGQWLTPPLSDGCLPGVMRGQALKHGLIQEQSLSAKPHPGDQWLLINSLGCRTISQVNGEPLTNRGNGETLWRSLLPSHSEISLPP
ncbi:aminotransferase class IV [bacterium]|nr:aminotransferase class IV [bacterium]